MFFGNYFFLRYFESYFLEVNEVFLEIWWIILGFLLFFIREIFEKIEKDKKNDNFYKFRNILGIIVFKSVCWYVVFFFGI